MNSNLTADTRIATLTVDEKREAAAKAAGIAHENAKGAGSYGLRILQGAVALRRAEAGTYKAYSRDMLVAAYGIEILAALVDEGAAS